MRRFPALYRMPVAYLTAATVAGGWLVARGMPRSEWHALDLGSLTGAATASPEDRPDVAPAASPPGRPEQPDAILRNAAGLRRKVVINGLDVVPRRTPSSDATGRPLDDYAIRFVHGESPTMLRVGPLRGAPEGWVPRESVVEWDTRLMARPAPRGSRPALILYRDEPCLAAAVAGRPCPNHAGRCPTEGEEPAEVGPVPDLGWPVLRSDSVAGPDGSSRSIYEVAALVSDRAPPSPRPEQIAALRPALRGLYVVFVIDTTASMRPRIDAAKALAVGLADRIARDHSDMLPHLALVEYRDDAPGYGFRARLTTKFTEVAGFRAYAEALAAAKPDDGSPDESVLDGIALALPGTPGGVGWPSGPTGELATKMIVLIGDAPDHDRDLGRARALAERARAAGISIAAVTVDGPGALVPDDRARFESQWRALAEGSYRPTARAGSPAAPLVIRVDQPDALEARLRALIDDRRDRVRDVAALDAAEAEGRLKDYVDSRGRTLAQVAPVFVDLHRVEPDPTPRPDPRFNGRKAPAIRRGWVAERMGGETLLNVKILMTRDELDALIAEFASLQQAMSTSTSSVAELPVVDPDTFFGMDRGPQTFADDLRQRRHLPIRAGSPLERTQADFLRVDDLDRLALDPRLRAAILGLTKRRNSADWSDPRRTVEGMGTVPYDLIDF